MPRVQLLLCFTLIFASVTLLDVVSAHLKIKPSLPNIEPPQSIDDVEPYCVKVVTIYVSDLEKECPKTSKFKSFFEKLRGFAKYVVPIKRKGQEPNYDSDMKAKAGSLFQAISSFAIGRIKEEIIEEKNDAIKTFNFMKSIAGRIMGRGQKSEASGKLTTEQQTEIKEGILKWETVITRITNTMVISEEKSSSSSEASTSTKEESSSSGGKASEESSSKKEGSSSKSEESKSEGSKNEESKSEGYKKEGSKSEGSKKEGSKSEGSSSKSEESKSEESKSEGSKKEGSKSEGSKKEGSSSKSEESKSEGSKSEESKSEGSKKEGSKSEGSKKEGSKSEGSKKEGSKSEGSKKEGSKSEGSKKESSSSKSEGSKGTATFEDTTGSASNSGSPSESPSSSPSGSSSKTESKKESASGKKNEANGSKKTKASGSESAEASNKSSGSESTKASSESTSSKSVETSSKKSVTVQEVEAESSKEIMVFIMNLEKKCPQKEEYKSFFEKLKATMTGSATVTKKRGGIFSGIKSAAGKLSDAMAFIRSRIGSKSAEAKKSMETYQAQIIKTMEELDTIHSQILSENKGKSKATLTCTPEQQTKIKQTITRWEQVTTQFVEVAVQSESSSSSSSSSSGSASGSLRGQAMAN